MLWVVGVQNEEEKEKSGMKVTGVCFGGGRGAEGWRDEGCVKICLILIPLSFTTTLSLGLSFAEFAEFLGKALNISRLASLGWLVDWLAGWLVAWCRVGAVLLFEFGYRRDPLRLLPLNYPARYDLDRKDFFDETEMGVWK
ncbi:hypothetical protein M0802_007235 [Mischocyttarus mexicanus]|nr:hypothetical protein M0802_007235 [Mischocyttarus mexicanus]